MPMISNLLCVHDIDVEDQEELQEQIDIRMDLLNREIGDKTRTIICKELKRLKPCLISKTSEV